MDKVETKTEAPKIEQYQGLEKKPNKRGKILKTSLFVLSIMLLFVSSGFSIFTYQQNLKLESENAEYKKDIEKTTQELADLREDLNKQINSINEEKNALQSDFDKAKTDLSNMTESKTEVQKELDAANEKIASLQAAHAKQAKKDVTISCG